MWGLGGWVRVLGGGLTGVCIDGLILSLIPAAVQAACPSRVKTLYCPLDTPILCVGEANKDTKYLTLP